MKSFRKSALAALAGAIALGVGLSAHAAVGADQAERLGRELTPVGGEMAGNADGSTPAWEGGITQPPAGYRIGEFHIDPYVDDKAKFSITPQNYKQHADKLTEGQKAMFERYDTFGMDVYPTRRSASFPQRTYEYTKRNATQCKLVANGEGIENCAEGFPFPVPQNAHEVIWNHKLKYKGLSVLSYSTAPAQNEYLRNLILTCREFQWISLSWPRSPEAMRLP